MKLFLQCLFSPNLYKVFGDHALYQPLGSERWGNKVLNTLRTLWNIGLYTSPFITLYSLKQGYPNDETMKFIACCVSGLSCLVVMAHIARAYGRANNPQYLAFIRALNGSTQDMNAYLSELRKYDFDYSAWPVSYSILNKESSSYSDTMKSTISENLPAYQKIPIKMLAFFAIHTFGLRLVYPGTLSLIHYFLENALLQGRIELVEVYNGLRTKIETAEGNHIDTMFVDARSKGVRGRTLIVCCEGNSGFYEVGIMATPVKAGFSALGWNHPGFMTSTGKPFPNQEKNAIDAVMQFAINDLGFKPQDIVLFGWSIGGYTATWAAVNYPDIKALILDATFDDLLPLALNQMPSSWATLVEEVIRGYVDLNIADLLEKYRGPVQLVRRTEDEIICLRQGQLSTNRANDLVQRLVAARHPRANPDTVAQYVSMLDTQRSALIFNDPNIKDYSSLRLINRYMRDYKSSHCTPLPVSDFEQIMINLINPH